MSLVVPSWFKQRQGKAEPVGELVYKVTAPNTRAAFVAVRPDGNGRYAAAVQEAADGPELDATQPIFSNPFDAWEAAFELYRRALIV